MASLQAAGASVENGCSPGGTSIRALVTGATGLLGTFACQALRRAGWEVVGLARRAPVHSSAVPVRIADVCDWNSLREMLANDAADAVVHLAGLTRGASLREFVATNVSGTANLLAVLAEVNPGARIVVVGSSAEYGDLGPAPVSEDAIPRPHGPYAVSKRCQTEVALEAAREGQPVLIARVFNPIGPGLPREYFVGSLVAQFARLRRARGHPVVRLGRLDTVRDFVDVRDIAGALVALAREGQPGEVYNVATGIGCPLGELVRLLTELTGLRPEIETVPALVRPDDVPVSVGSAAKLRQMVRWEPQFDLRESLADMLREAEDATASEEVDPR